MMYLSMAIHNIAVMIFTAYMVIHVHPIWAVCILFTHRIGTKVELELKLYVFQLRVMRMMQRMMYTGWIGMKKMIATTQVETSFKNVEKALKENGLYEAYDDMVLIKQALIERDRKIYGLQQHNRNLEDKLGRIGGYHYGNPKQ